MKALVCRELVTDIGRLGIEEMRLPPLKEGEARVRVRAAAANFVDILQVQGKHQHKIAPPFVPGLEAAGEVTAVGEGVTHVKPGDRVSVGGMGCFAEETQGPAKGLRRIPDHVDYATAAAFRVGYLTAYVALVRRGRLEPGEWLLVHGAAGGMGLAAVDLGKALGARVIATASTETKRAFLRSYGADHVLSSRGFRLPVKELTDGGADVIYDPVGGDVFDESTRCIGFCGRLLVIGFTSGRIPTVAANIPLVKSFSVVGVRAGEYGRRYPQKGEENLAAIERLLAEGKIRPHIGARLPFSRVVDAIRMLEDRSIIGKVVVEM